MADACVESSSDCPDRISGNNSSFYAESSSSEENLQYEEPRKSFSFVEKQKLRSEETNSSLQRSAKQKSAKKTKQASGNRNFSVKGASKNTLLSTVCSSDILIEYW